METIFVKGYYLRNLRTSRFLEREPSIALHFNLRSRKAKNIFSLHSASRSGTHANSWCRWTKILLYKIGL